MTIRKDKLLLVGTSASTGVWYPVDYRFDVMPIRTISGTLTAGDTIYIEGTTDAVIDVNGVSVSVSVVTTIATFTTTPFGTQITSPWAAIRARKTGTTGTAVVNGLL